MIAAAKQYILQAEVKNRSTCWFSMRGHTRMWEVRPKRPPHTTTPSRLVPDQLGVASSNKPTRCDQYLHGVKLAEATRRVCHRGVATVKPVPKCCRGCAETKSYVSRKNPEADYECDCTLYHSLLASGGDVGHFLCELVSPRSVRLILAQS